MGRIVVNKHFDDVSNISSGSFVHKGELIISNQVGYEGIFITNTKGEMLFIAPTSGSSADVPKEYKDYIENFVTGKLDNYLTSAQTIDLIIASASSESISEEEVVEIVSEQVSSALVLYLTSAQTIDYITETLKNYVTSADSITVSQVEEITALKIAEIVNSADTSYDTLKEIADWILNDTTGAAALANDVKELKEISASTRLSILETSSHTHDNFSVLCGITSNDIVSWNNAEENAKSFASAYTESALTVYATKTYVDEAVKTKPTSSNFVFLTTEQYRTLYSGGTVEVNGETLTSIDDNTYYALYEPEE